MQQTRPLVGEPDTAVDQPPTDEIMARLRAETREHHTRAEKQRFQSRLVTGGVDRAQYASWLVQLSHIHRVLEQALTANLEDPRFAAVAESQWKSELIENDLQQLPAPGVDALFAPTTALVALLERTAEHEPVGLLGHHYVLEGSMNGNRFIARKLESTWENSAGLSYLDPYGEEQRPLWQQFRSDMNKVELTSAEKDTIVRCAKAMFDGIAEISSAMPGD